MAVVFDASYLIKLLDSTVRGDGRIDARLAFLLQSLERSRTKIVVPTPALSEVLVGAGTAAARYLDVIARSSRFRIAPFGTRAAVEAAAAHREAILGGDKREGGEASWRKVKFDRQIVAIAKVEGAPLIYSDDADIARLSRRDGIEVIDFDQLPYPPEAPQGELRLDPAPEDDGMTHPPPDAEE